jgi:hypothetical protein
MKTETDITLPVSPPTTTASFTALGLTPTNPPKPSAKKSPLF